MVNIHKLASVTESSTLSATHRYLPGAFTGLFSARFPCKRYKLQGFSLMVNKLQSASELSSDILPVMVLPERKRNFFQTLDRNKPSDPNCSVSPNHFQYPIPAALVLQMCCFPPPSSVKKKTRTT